jgi:hypothetical protein
VPEIEASLPVLLPAQPDWTLTASHNAAAAPRAVTLAGWSSGAPQQAGMWFQIDLPQPAVIAEVQFDAAATGRGGGGGGRGAAAGGRGTAAATPPTAGADPTAGVAGRAALPAAQPAPIGFPREYQIQVSMDGKTWSAPVSKGPGATLILASFAPVRGRSIRITQTATPDAGAPPWSIQNLRIYQGRLTAGR